MVDFTSTQAQVKEFDTPVRRGEAEAAVAKSPSTPPPLTTDGVDRMYRQLAEIHTIAVEQLAECACWHRIDSTPRSIQAGTSQPRPGAVPSATRLAPSPSVNFSSQAPLWPRQGRCDES
jgi:hypothetical protein